MYSNYRLRDIERNLSQTGSHRLDVLVVGQTGCGKSSTLNALFGKEVVSVGHGIDPETMKISAVSLNEKLRFWDTPGLGISVETDNLTKRALVNKLSEGYGNRGQYGVIDLVVVIVDGSSRDMYTTHELLAEVIMPNIQADRVLVAINQADMVRMGRHWDYSFNRPDSALLASLEERTESVRKRLMASTNLHIAKPVYYSAECGYHICEFLDMIIDNMPREKRLLERTWGGFGSGAMTNKSYRIEDISRNLSKAGFRPLDVLVVGGNWGG